MLQLLSERRPGRCRCNFYRWSSIGLRAGTRCSRSLGVACEHDKSHCSRLSAKLCTRGLPVGYAWPVQAVCARVRGVAVRRLDRAADSSTPLPEGGPRQRAMSDHEPSGCAQVSRRHWADSELRCVRVPGLCETCLAVKGGVNGSKRLSVGVRLNLSDGYGRTRAPTSPVRRKPTCDAVQHHDCPEARPARGRPSAHPNADPRAGIHDRCRVFMEGPGAAAGLGVGVHTRPDRLSDLAAAPAPGRGRAGTPRSHARVTPVAQA